MKRLLKISFDLSLLSFIPIISWFLLGIIVDKNLINIFTLTYPLQFIYYILKSIFSTGANINKEKDNNKNAVMSGMFIGTIVAIIIFLIILINIDNYIIFMNMDVNIYKTFTIYSVLQLFVCLEFAMILNKLYYEEKNQDTKYHLLEYCRHADFYSPVHIHMHFQSETVSFFSRIIPTICPLQRFR